MTGRCTITTRGLVLASFILLAAIPVRPGKASAGSESRILAQAGGPIFVSASQPMTFDLSVTSKATMSVLFDVEIYDPTGTRISQQAQDNQQLTVSQTADVLFNWQVPDQAVDGLYTVKAGIFAPGWGENEFWNDQAAQFSVSDANGDPPPAAASIAIALTFPLPAPPPPYFATLPPGSTLPSDAQCAEMVRLSGWEPRPGNTIANQTTGTTVSSMDGVDAVGNALFASRIDGNYTGTTDEIIQWGACKWGFDENTVRAIAAQESWWNQSTVGDMVNGQGQSFGLLQVRAPVHSGTFPWSQNSTAFNIDYALAWRRACFEGYLDWLPASAKGDEWGCIGLWFSGQWYDQGAQNYIASVKTYLAQQVWLRPDF